MVFSVIKEAFSFSFSNIGAAFKMLLVPFILAIIVSAFWFLLFLYFFPLLQDEAWRVHSSFTKELIFFILIVSGNILSILFGIISLIYLLFSPLVNWMRFVVNKETMNSIKVTYLPKFSFREQIAFISLVFIFLGSCIILLIPALLLLFLFFRFQFWPAYVLLVCYGFYGFYMFFRLTLIIPNFAINNILNPLAALSISSKQKLNMFFLFLVFLLISIIVTALTSLLALIPFLGWILALPISFIYYYVFTYTIMGTLYSKLTLADE